MISKLYILEYDFDWGMRGTRRKRFWFFNTRLSKNQIKQFIEESTNLEYDSRKIKFRLVKSGTDFLIGD